jgi:transposase
MSQMPESPATTPIPVQLSEPEFIAFIFPHLSMPRRGPKCKLGYHRVFNLILWVLYTGMQWKCLPVPEAGDGTAVIHDTTIYKVFAKWSDDGSLDQAFIASVRHLAEQNHLDLSILHGDGPTPSPRKAATASATPATSTRRARRSWRSSRTTASCWPRCRWRR